MSTPERNDTKSSTTATMTTSDGSDASASTADDTASTTDALLTAISLVSHLASLDAQQYKEETSASTSPTTSTSIQSQLDILQSKWTLEDTSLPHLTESIHRLQSNAILLQNEASTATDEVAALQTALTESQAKARRLERIVRKLFDENERLRKKLTKRRKKSEAFVRNVREAMGSMKGLKGMTGTEDSRNDAESDDAAAATTSKVIHQLQRHEVILKRASSASASATSNRRQRALTADSALFSDLDESTPSSPFRSYNYDYDFSGSAPSSKLNDCDSDIHNDDDEEASVSSSSSAPSLITEQSMPTISLKATASFPPTPIIDSTTLLGDEEEEDEIETPCNVYRLDFPVGRQIGIELQRVPLKKKEADPKEASPVYDNRFDDEHSYTLADAAKEMSSDIKAFGALIGNVGKTALTSVTSADESQGKHGKKEPPEFAFLVCGYCSAFDSILNKRPPIGSRLIAIDDVSLETGTWSSFAKVRECIQSKSRNTKARTFRLVFRMDPLNEEQRIILEKAVAFAERQEKNKRLGAAQPGSEEKEEEFLLVPSQPAEKDERAPQKAQGSMHSVNSCESATKKVALPPPPGPEEVKLALKAFSTKMKAIL